MAGAGAVAQGCLCAGCQGPHHHSRSLIVGLILRSTASHQKRHWCQLLAWPEVLKVLMSMRVEQLRPSTRQPCSFGHRCPSCMLTTSSSSSSHLFLLA